MPTRRKKKIYYWVSYLVHYKQAPGAWEPKELAVDVHPFQFVADEQRDGLAHLVRLVNWREISKQEYEFWWENLG